MPPRNLNWRKGLFRLWLFLSAVWIVTIGILGLYPATSRYIEGAKATHELVSLQASIRYAFLDESDNEYQIDTTGQMRPIDSFMLDAKRFALDAARKAGKSDEEIAHYLGQIKQFDIDKAIETGKTYSQVAEYLATHQRASADIFLCTTGPKRPFKVRESQTGVTLTVVWCEAYPPSEADLDEVFKEAFLRQEMNSLPREVELVGPLHGRFEFPTIFKDEQQAPILNAKLQRISNLKEILESRKNSKQDFLFSLGMTVLPPAAALILGMGFIWVLSGFALKVSK